AAQEFFQPRGIERLVGAEDERADFVVVVVMMMVMFVMAVIPAFAFVVVIMVVIMAVGVAMRRVGVLVGQEVRVDVEDGIQVEAADVDDGLQVGVAEVHRRNGRARVDANQAGAQRFVVGFVDQIFFRDQDAVGEPDLFLGFFLGV